MPFARTLERLEALKTEVRRHEGINVNPTQLAARLLEKTTERVTGDEVGVVVRR